LWASTTSHPAAARAADEACGGERVVGGPERPDRRVPVCCGAGERGDPEDLERLLVAERRQQRRQALREHRLAGAGRAAEQEVVGTGGCDLQRPDGVVLAAHLSQVGQRRGRPAGRRPGRGRGSIGRAAMQDANGGGQAFRDRDGEAVDERCLLGARAGEDERAQPEALRGVRDGEGAARAAYAAVEGELAEQAVAAQPLRWELPGRGEDRAREREVEPRPRLGDVRGREVDGDPPRRELEARIEDRRPDALARLAYGGVREADDRERGQAGADVDLDRDVAGIEPVDRERVSSREHRLSSPGLGQGRLGAAWDGTRGRPPVAAGRAHPSVPGRVANDVAPGGGHAARPARSAFGERDGVEAFAVDDHECVFGVGVDRDLAPRAGFAVGLEPGRVER
jgi:hypothetical protein